ncbi:MAG TPA: hypothetical protein VNV85_05360 [Puia sp.]|jgi:hypothetical protein|nr:hypothetical protein [Puia sp.]
MKPSTTFYERRSGTVNTIHVLKSGKIIRGVKDYLEVESHFLWVDRRSIVEKILRLKKLTDERKNSVIVLYEDGQHIREFINVEYSFLPLAYC